MVEKEMTHQRANEPERRHFVELGMPINSVVHPLYQSTEEEGCSTGIPTDIGPPGTGRKKSWSGIVQTLIFFLYS
jgi:hypothetical protein